jgi:hypothetical protein
MVKSALGCDGVALICRDHKFVASVANDILGNDTTAPQKWRKKRFDLVWVSTGTHRGRTTTSGSSHSFFVSAIASQGSRQSRPTDHGR